ncbi:UDP-N-acetylmuramoyl-L-alanyl-D-glutamate--2,6-diaminopimelate ligase [Anaerobacillus sp. MEB173]|uniref:UDP-N-acetylmuramoyl-L-alanyl-D-glutamate--2, 6-diaminopimelate ligase n=1 Tax=Anaerobacillus sp. MEB173 TaxID=3383345 RepID=UPI003F93C3BF
MKLQDLIQELLLYSQTNKGNPEIESIEMDSRQVKKGSLFVCIKGYTVDGHDYVQQAVDAGAVAILAAKEVNATVPVIVVKDTVRAMAILANRFYDNPTKKMTLIGVTGTNGKTTVTHLVERVLTEYGDKTGLIGTMYMKIGDKKQEVKNTTPESLSLQKSFQEMVNENVDTAVMEVSSHALHLGRVRGCDFNIAVFTNLTQDHLDYHKTMDAYLHAKGLLFAQLGNTYDQNTLKIAILNSDDPASEEYEKMTSAQVLTYGIDTNSDYLAKDIEITARGTKFTLAVGKEEMTIQLKLIGKFSVYNALAAIAASHAYGVPLDKIKSTLEGIEGVAGRFEAVDEGQPYSVIVDYAHTPDSLENVLVTVNEFVKGKVTVVVGCGGDRDRTKRPLMAQIATKYADKAVFTSDNPRTEDPETILKDMEAGVEGEQFVSFIDRRDAIFHAISSANVNDVVVIAGKGHETYQIIGTDVIEFDDRQVARTAIKERKS